MATIYGFAGDIESPGVGLSTGLDRALGTLPTYAGGTLLVGLSRPSLPHFCRKQEGDSCHPLGLDGFAFEAFVFVFGISQEVTLPRC